MSDKFATPSAVRARVDFRDEIAAEIERAATAHIQYDDDDWTRIADVVLPIIAKVLRQKADAIEATDSQLGIASRALSPGKAYAVAYLRDEATRLTPANAETTEGAGMGGGA